MQSENLRAGTRQRGYWEAVLNWGLYLGAALALVVIIQVGIVGTLRAGVWVGLAQWFALFVMAYRGMIAYQKASGGIRVGYWKNFGLGMLISALGAVVYACVFWIMIVYVHPQYYTDMRNVMDEVMLKKVSTLEEEQGELVYSMYKEVVSPLLIAFSMMIGMVINSIFSNLVAALWGKQSYRLRQSIQDNQRDEEEN